MTQNNIIGSDEVLKGDTFGGIVVCGARFCEDEEERLLTIGVRDSKKISPDKLERIAYQLLETFPERFVVKELEPEHYNAELEHMNLTRLMDKLHIEVANELREHCDEECIHVVDLYPGCGVGDKQVKGAESEYVAVAAASIVARSKAMAQFVRLSAKAGFKLPLGSTHVTEALERLKREGKDFRQYAKLHFKNVQKIMQASVGEEKQTTL